MGGGVELLILVIIVGCVFYFFFYRKKAGKHTSEIITKKEKVNSTLPNEKRTIFINYRKQDSSGYSLALYNELIKWYDKKSIFKDFNNIEPGEDFEESIDNALNNCNILLIILADKWIDILKDRNSKTQEPDYVELEISKALAKNIYIIPIVINNTRMPTAEELPGSLKKLSTRQYLNIDQTRFETDSLKLRDIIDRRLGINR